MADFAAATAVALEKKAFGMSPEDELIQGFRTSENALTHQFSLELSCELKAVDPVSSWN